MSWRFCVWVAPALFLSIVSAAAAPIDFTPRRAEVLEDGLPAQRLHFLKGTQRIFFRPPPKWKIEGNSTAALLTPPNRSGAFAKLENLPVSRLAPFDENNLDAYRQAAANLLPKEAVLVRVVRETPDAIPLNDWQAHEFVLSYVLAGRASLRSVLFVTLDSERQIVFSVDALKQDFDAVRAPAWAALRTWYEEIEPRKRPAGP